MAFLRRLTVMNKHIVAAHPVTASPAAASPLGGELLDTGVGRRRYSSGVELKVGLCRLNL
jgi:hypothetical protein